MPPLTAIERFFERLFERPSARLFRARLQPDPAPAADRARDGGASAWRRRDRTLVPNRFVVHLHPDDLAGFGDMTGSLASELADGALSFARAHRYTLVDRPRVDLLADPTRRADRHPRRRPLRRRDRRARRARPGRARPGRRARRSTTSTRPRRASSPSRGRRTAARRPARHRPRRPDPRGRRSTGGA